MAAFLSFDSRVEETGQQFLHFDVVVHLHHLFDRLLVQVDLFGIVY